MNKQFEYITIEYYPKTFNSEHINVAFAMHDPNTGEIMLNKAANIKRVTDFDDEIDASTFSAALDSVCEYIKKPFSMQADLFPEENQAKRFDEDYFNGIRRLFLNQFRFSKTFYCDPNDFGKSFALFEKVALYYDKDKKNRASKNEIITAMKLQLSDILRKSGKEYKETAKTNEMTFGEKLRFDYIIKNYVFVKVLNTFGSGDSNKIGSAKEWYFNSTYFAGDSRKLIIVIPDSDSNENSEDLMLIMKILEKADAKIMKPDEFASALSNSSL